jgi:pentatricopeptide repeat protein
MYYLKATDGDDKNKKQYKNMEEAKEAFKQMLEDKKVSPDAKWNEAMAKGIANDKRFRALKTMAQRKQVSSTDLCALAWVLFGAFVLLWCGRVYHWKIALCVLSMHRSILCLSIYISTPGVSIYPSINLSLSIYLSI